MSIEETHAYLADGIEKANLLHRLDCLEQENTGLLLYIDTLEKSLRDLRDSLESLKNILNGV